MHSFVSFPFPTDWDTDMMVGTGAVTLGSGVIAGVRALKSTPPDYKREAKLCEREVNFYFT